MSVEKSPEVKDREGGSGGGLALGCARGGGGCGRSAKAGIPARKFATSRGLSHKSDVVKLVGCAGHENRCDDEASAVPQSGHTAESALPIRKRKS